MSIDKNQPCVNYAGTYNLTQMSPASKVGDILSFHRSYSLTRKAWVVNALCVGCNSLQALLAAHKAGALLRFKKNSLKRTVPKNNVFGTEIIL